MNGAPLEENKKEINPKGFISFLFSSEASLAVP